MSIDYVDLAATVLAALTDAAPIPITRRSYTTGTYDPTTGAATTTTADTTRTGVCLDFGAGQTLERGTLIQHGDKRLLLDASTGVAMQDHFIINGTEYTIVSIGNVVEGANVLYDIHLRT